MNSRELRIAMVRNNISTRDLAMMIGLSEQALYNKINGATEFKNSEIKKIAKFLNLSLQDVNNIFFDGAVNQIHISY